MAIKYGVAKMKDKGTIAAFVESENPVLEKMAIDKIEKILGVRGGIDVQVSGDVNGKKVTGKEALDFLRKLLNKQDDEKDS